MKTLLHLFLFTHSLLLSSMSHATELQAFEQDFSDSMITTKITAKFTKDKHLNPLKILVSTENGQVRLRGHVKNKEAFVDALKLAATTRGVKCVDTEELHIKVVNTLFTDAYITAKVEAAVLKAKVLDDESIPLVGINAHTKNGVVTLSGTLPGDKAIAAIIKRTSYIKGVKKVISHLESKGKA